MSIRCNVRIPGLRRIGAINARVKSRKMTRRVDDNGRRRRVCACERARARRIRGKDRPWKASRMTGGRGGGARGTQKRTRRKTNERRLAETIEAWRGAGVAGLLCYQPLAFAISPPHRHPFRILDAPSFYHCRFIRGAFPVRYTPPPLSRFPIA